MPGRLLSLDAYRGFILLLLISHGFGFASLKDSPGWEWLARQVDHVEWEGCVFWDLIQPAFTFMVGVAMPFALSRRAGFGGQLRHAAWRCFALILLSNFLSNFGSTGGLKAQFINVLCQIAFGYFLCFLILRLPLRWQVAAGAALLLGHWGLYLMFPGPEGPFSREGNIGARIDLALLGYNYRYHYVTINFIGNAVTILFGCWAGMLVRSPWEAARKLRWLLGAAAANAAAGLLLEAWNPMVKRLWTASFTLYSAGWVVLMLAFFYWLVEVQGARRWTFPFVVLGTNSIFIYSFSQVLHGWLFRGLGAFTSALGPIPQHLVTLAAMWGLCYWLYRRQIFFKI